MPDTIVQRVTALEASHADHEQRLVELERVRLAEVERQLGLPPGGIRAAEESLDRFLASLDQKMK